MAERFLNENFEEEVETQADRRKKLYTHTHTPIVIIGFNKTLWMKDDEMNSFKRKTLTDQKIYNNINEYLSRYACICISTCTEEF